MNVETITNTDSRTVAGVAEPPKKNGKLRPETLFGLAVMNRLTTTVVEVTPEIAEMLLAMRPPYQRPVRPSRVKAFAALMRDGRFLTTHQGIAFDREGHLIDGQHRLQAVVDTGVTIETSASFGLPHDAFRAMDRGAARSVADDLQADGLFSSTHEACTFSAAARFLSMLDVGNRITSTKNMGPWTLDKALDVNERHPDLILGAKLAQMLPRSIPKAPFAAVWAAFAAKDRKTADAFAAGMISGEDMSGGNPILRLREWCMGSSRSRGIRLADDFIFRAINAWNNLRRGRDIQILRGAQGESPTYPKIV